jgi:hypothetical protein
MRITAGQRLCHSDVTPGTVNCSRPGRAYGRYRRGRWPRWRTGARRNDSRGKREGQGTRWVTGKAGAPPRSRSGPRRIHPRAASRRGGRLSRRPGGRRGRRPGGRRGRRRAGLRRNRGRQRQSGGRQVPRCGRRRQRSGRRRRGSGPWPAGRRETVGQRTDRRRMRNGRRLTGARKTDTRETSTPGTDTPGTDTRETSTPGTDTRETSTPGTGTPGTDTRETSTPGTGSGHGTASRRGQGIRRVTAGGQETTDGGLVQSRPTLVRPRLAPRMRRPGPRGAPGRKVFARGVAVIQRVRRLPARRQPQVRGRSALLPQNGARKG